MKRQEIGILIIGLAAFLGFTPIFQALNSTISSEMVGAAFSAIFILVTTKLLISHQSDLDEKGKRSEHIFAKRLDLYRTCTDAIITIIDSSQISARDMSSVRKCLVELEAMAPDKVIRSYLDIVTELSSSIGAGTLQESEGFSESGKLNPFVEIKPEITSEIWKKLRVFAHDVREDLDLAGIKYSGKEKEDFSKMMTTAVTGVEASINSLSAKQPLAGGIDEFFVVGNRNQDTPEARKAIKVFTDVILAEMPRSRFDIFKSMIRFSYTTNSRATVLLNISRISKTALRISFPSSVRGAVRNDLTKKLGQTGWEIFPDGAYLAFNFPIEYNEGDLNEVRSMLSVVKGDVDARTTAD